MLLVVPQPFYEDRGTSIALHHLLRALSELGHPVDVLCFGPGRDVNLPGVRTFRVPNPLRFEHVPIGLSGRKLLLDGLLFQTLRRRLERERYLFVHAVEEAALLATAVRGRRRIFITYDMQSSLPEQLLQYRGFRSRAAQALAGRIERRLLRRVDLVVCSDGLEDIVRGCAPHTPVVPWRFPASLEPPPPAEQDRLRAELRLPPEARVVLYMGSFARYQGMSLLRDAIPRVLAAVPDAVFVAVGAASRSEMSFMRDGRPPAITGRTRILRRIDRAAVPGHLALADVLLLPRIHGSNLPLKTYDYLAAGKTIVASDLAAHRWLEREGLALLAPADPNGFADVVRRALDDRELAERLQGAAREYADRHLGWPHFRATVETIVRQVREQAAHGYRRA